MWSPNPDVAVFLVVATCILNIKLTCQCFVCLRHVCSLMVVPRKMRIIESMFSVQCSSPNMPVSPNDDREPLTSNIVI